MLPRKLQLWHALIIVGLVSLVTRLLFWGHPGSIVFDEVWFGQFASDYTKGSFYFDVHPPLAKLLFFWVGSLGGPINFPSNDTIGAPYHGLSWELMRLVPLLTGASIPVLMALLLKELKLPTPIILLGALPACFDTALVADSRFILPESLLVAAILGTVVLYLVARRRRSWTLWLAVGLMAGLTVSIKWTGLAGLGIILLGELWTFLKAPYRWLRFILRCGIVLVLAFAVYYSVFQIHFALLPNAGPGDAFMTPAFQKSLLGSQYAGQANLPTLGPWAKFCEMNVRMYTANETLVATHPYASMWYTWPFDIRPIYYWAKNDQRIYFLGNPVVWWGSTAAVALLFLLLWTQRLKHQPKTTFLLAAWAINYLPFIFIGRVMFLYHYLTALTLALSIGVWLLAQTKRPILWLSLTAGASLALFVWFAPLVYGLPLSNAGLAARQWFTSWR